MFLTTMWKGSMDTGRLLRRKCRGWGRAGLEARCGLSAGLALEVGLDVEVSGLVQQWLLRAPFLVSSPPCHSSELVVLTADGFAGAS